MMKTDHENQLRMAMEKAHITVPDSIIADGNFHRFPTGTCRNNRDGWYVVHADAEIAVGAFGCWRERLKEGWTSHEETKLTKRQRARLRQSQDDLKRQCDEEERRRQAEAAVEAARVWEASAAAPGDHPYLVRKKISGGDLRIYGDCLVVPVQDLTGQIHSLQTIPPNGKKKFLPGGRVKGCFTLIGVVGEILCIAEGFATAASVHDATGYPVVVAFSAGNMLPVSQIIRSAYPRARIILCGDNDANNTGQRAARETAEAVGACVIIPPQEGWDWNDVATQHGLEAVREAVSSALIPDAHVLDDLHHYLGRFVAYPSPQAQVAHTLWIAHTHLMHLWESTPRIAFLSTEPSSGKTRALEITETVVPRPVESMSATPAYLYRKVSDPKGLPTILFDEIDTIFGPRAKEHEEIRGLLNAGHRRGATAGRCVVKGKAIETEDFPAFCAVALAGLGDLPDTILSRTIVIRMRRRAPTEQVESYRRRLHAPEGHQIRERLKEWAQKIGPTLNLIPDMPIGITDRPADVWEPLLSVADAAGPTWSRRGREAAVALVADVTGERQTIGVRLLADLRTVFGGRPAVATSDILNSLNGLEESPWGDLKGKALDSRRLAKFLRQYGVRPKDIRLDKDVIKGYSAEDLFDPWQRYLPPSPPENATSATEETGELRRLTEDQDVEVNLDA